MKNIATLRIGLELVLSLGALAGAAWLTAPEEMVWSGDGFVAIALLAVAVVWGMQIMTVGLDLFQPVVTSVGLALMTAALLSYTRFYTQLPAISLAGGALLAALSIWVMRAWIPALWLMPQIVLVGQDPLGRELAQGLGKQLLGVVGKSAELMPEGIRYLGSFDQLSAVITEHQPSILVVEEENWRHWISPQLLLNYKVQGGVVETTAAMYGRVFMRIHLRAFKLTDVLWADTQRANRRVMVLQAIYSNIIGLVLLVISAPVLVVLGLASRFAAGAGTTFDSVECAGFQSVPFQRRRFHIRHAVTGEMTWLGRIIDMLHLTGLPQVISLVRGEMGLFGPKPVRMEFASYLDRVCSLYSYRYSLKPGLFGWARAQYQPTREPEALRVQEENICLGYDLYYSEQASPILDILTLIRYWIVPARIAGRDSRG